MRQTVRTGLAALMVAGALGQSSAPAQQAPAKAKAANTPAQGPSPAVLAKLNETLATANGEKITRGEVIQILNSASINPGSEASFYGQAIDLLVSAKLLNQFLKANGVKVDPKDIDSEVDAQKKMFAENNQSLEAALAESGTTFDQMKDTLRERLLWRKYITTTATDDVLKRFMKDNIEVFNRAQVKASHIQLSLEPTASPEDKSKAREKLLKIKKEVESGAITFADAANKYSDDPSNVEQPSGGDLRYFPRKKFVEPFDNAAFTLPLNKVSDPVETEYGMHLILVTDKKPGVPVEFAQIKEAVLNQFALDEQNRIVADMRKKAKIDIKPLPADLFPKAPAAPATATPKPAAEPAKPKG